MADKTPIVWCDWLTIASYDFTAYSYAIAWLRRRDSMQSWQGATWLQYAGFKSDASTFYGHGIQSKREHYIIRASGFRSHEILMDLLDQDWAGKFYATRIDLQRTKPIPKDWWKPRDLRDWLQEQGITSSLVESDTGQTIYIGSRQSGRFTRIYEKHYEKKYLRLEIELKKGHADNAFVYLLDGQSLDDLYNAHLAKLPLFQTAKNYYLSTEGHELDLTLMEHETTVKKQLDWLKTLINTLSVMVNDHTIGQQTRDILYAILVNEDGDE